MENNGIFLYGNEKLKSFFSSSLENGKLAHAYILEGGRGSGKHTLARHLACLLCCSAFMERPCFSCESCRKIINGISPDVIEYSLPDDKKTIGVEQIRELRSSVYIKPTEEDVKVYIISNAEAMTEQAQNVFLKVLEEPPLGVYFIMLCENTSNILATVKSRAPVLKMQVFSDSELSDYLIQNNKNAKILYDNAPEDFNLAVRIAEGKIGEAERLINDNKSDKGMSGHEKAKNLIEMSVVESKTSDYVTYVRYIAKTREELQDVLLYATYAVRDLMAIKKLGECDVPLLFYSDSDYAERVAAEFTAAGVMKIYEILCRVRENLYRNTNLNNTLCYLTVEMKRAANL